ncbi:hypothetical protein D3C80_1724810 [compost metagenome]
MKRNNRDSSFRRQTAHSSVQPFLESAQLIIHSNSKRLKAAFGRMASCSSRSCRNPFLDQLYQLTGICNRLLFTPLDNFAGNPP